MELDEGSAEIGSYQISSLRSMHCNKPAVAHYFSHGNFGILYTPEISLSMNGQGVLYKAKTINEFIKMVNDNHGIYLHGFNFEGGVFSFTL
jgi:hypothetical protein